MNPPLRSPSRGLVLVLGLVVAFALPLQPPRVRAADEFFPVMAWNEIPADPAVIGRLKECGFTVAGFVSPAGLDLVHAAGLKAIVSDSRVSGYNWLTVDAEAAKARVNALLASTEKHPAVLGYSLVDEPNAAAFPGLAVVAEAIRARAPQHWAYINLFPNYASSTQLGTSNYVEYLDRFVASCHPKFLSYDHYAAMEDGTFRPQYWQNLEQMRSASRRAGVPFWNIVLSVGCVGYRVPTSADLHLQAYSTLAYGARGLTWFTYFTPPIGNFREAPIDPFGHETPAWSLLRQVNLQVGKLAPTLLKLRSDDVYHFGTLPPDTHAPTPTSLVQECGDRDFMVGDFTHEDGSRYVLVVNRNLGRSQLANKLRFFSTPKRIQQVSPWSGGLQGFEGEVQWISPGSGALLKVEW